MKRILTGLLAAALCLSLCACSQGEKADFDPAGDAQALLRADGAFSSSLTQIDQATACALYGIDEDTVTGCAVYASPSSAEELAIFTLRSGQAAEDAAAALQRRVEDRTEELEDYMPGETGKLEAAVVETRGCSALLVIAADYGPVNDFLEG